MKKKTRILLTSLSSFVLLFSCSGRNEDSWKNEVNEKLPEQKEISYTSYTLSPSGKVHVEDSTNSKTFETFSKPEASYTIPSGKRLSSSGADTYDIGSSFLMNVPMRISRETFQAKEGETDTGSAYKVLDETLCYYADHVTTLQFRMLDDGGFEFYTNGVSKLIEIQHMYDPEGPESEYIQVYGRFNMSLCYTADGLLSKETYETVDHNTKSDGYVSVSCTYNYQ
jgi:hypothetical protein